jgi:hypothetical protein
MFYRDFLKGMTRAGNFKPFFTTGWARLALSCKSNRVVATGFDELMVSAGCGAGNLYSPATGGAVTSVRCQVTKNSTVY